MSRRLIPGFIALLALLVGLLPALPASSQIVPVPIEFDWGDAPDSTVAAVVDNPPHTYPTVSADDGARHQLGLVLWLGDFIDPEEDGQPNDDATGDDCDIVLGLGCALPIIDDEDGISFVDPIQAGSTTRVDVSVTNGLGPLLAGAAVFNFWIDFNRDGDWDDAKDQVFADVTVVNGDNRLTFTVPEEDADYDICPPDSEFSVNQTTFARARLSTDTGLTPRGEANDGEVEDYQVVVNCPGNPPDPEIPDVFDFGDAPDASVPPHDNADDPFDDNPPHTYPTVLADNGPHHKIQGEGADPGLFFGFGADGEEDGEPHEFALGDSFEDGLTIGSLLPGTVSPITINVSKPGLVSMWVDFDRDGTFDGPFDDNDDERVLIGRAVNAGNNAINITVPEDAQTGASFARMRLSTDAVSLEQPTGFAPDGEVEDYRVFIGGDWGDAPDVTVAPEVDDPPHTYPTVLLQDGARHGITATRLGDCVTIDVDGQPDEDAAADECDDGIQFITPLRTGRTTQIRVRATGAGLLNGWFDLNRDGDWSDAGERLIEDVEVPAGTSTLLLRIPASASPGTTFTRFRYSTSPVASVLGPVPDGEVEDYEVEIESAGDDLLEVTKTGPTSASEGDQLEYTIQVTNNSSQDVVEATVVDDADADLENIQVQNDGGFVCTVNSSQGTDPNGEDVVCQGPLAAGQTRTILLSALVEDGADFPVFNNVTVEATGAGDPDDPDPSNNASEARTNRAGPANLCPGWEHLTGHTHIVGTSGNDTLIAPNNDPHVICGLDGDDHIEGGGGNDVLDGGRGDDTVFGQRGGDAIFGRSGDDDLRGGPGNHDVLRGGPGNDVIRGGSGAVDHIFGGTGTDSIFGGSGNDVIRGGDGNDTIRTGSGDKEIVRGGAGRDSIVGQGVDNNLLGGPGADVLRTEGSGDNILRGDSGNDRQVGAPAAGSSTSFHCGPGDADTAVLRGGTNAVHPSCENVNNQT